MRALDAFLVHFDNAWNHDWESLRTVLEGVGEEEAHWQAPCYREASADDDAAPPGSIRWQVAHVANCKRGYTARLQGDRTARTPDLPPRPTASFAEELDELRAAHEAQRAAIATLGDDELTPVVADFLANTIRHDIWHAAQIAVARRLWRTRHSS